MKKFLFSIFLLVFSFSVQAEDALKCPKGQQSFTSAGHTLCAKITTQKNTINIVLPAGAGSPLDDMHKTFGDKIYQDYVQGVKVRKIPMGVQHVIDIVQYQGNTYKCKNLIVTSNAILKMMNCAKQDAAKTS